MSTYSPEEASLFSGWFLREHCEDPGDRLLDSAALGLAERIFLQLFPEGQTIPGAGDVSNAAQELLGNKWRFESGIFCCCLHTRCQRQVLTKLPNACTTRFRHDGKETLATESLLRFTGKKMEGA